jgi:arylformamidase
MRIHDISMPVSPAMLYWPGCPPVGVSWFAEFSKGDNSRHSVWNLSMHAGTHIDSPAHVLPDGFKLDSFNLESFVGQALVLDLSAIQHRIEPADLGEVQRQRPSRVLFKTSNSIFRHDKPFDQNYVALSSEGAQFLVDNGVILVGIDYLGIEPFTNLPFCPTHEVLMKAGMPIIEGLDLRGVEPGSYFLVCLPLRLVGAEASVARAVLIEFMFDQNAGS